MPPGTEREYSPSLPDGFQNRSTYRCLLVPRVQTRFSLLSTRAGVFTLLCQYFAQTKMSKNRTKGERAGQAGQLEGMCSILRQRSP